MVKTYLGNLGVDALEDRSAALPDHYIVKEDFRLVTREKGGFNNRLDSVTGRHGDLFDGFKLSINSLNEGDSRIEASAAQTTDRKASYGQFGNIDRKNRMSDTPDDDDQDTVQNLI